MLFDHGAAALVQHGDKTRDAASGVEPSAVNLDVHRHHVAEGEDLARQGGSVLDGHGERTDDVPRFQELGFDVH